MAEIRSRCADGMPVYGECGGFMYMTEGIVDKGGVLHGMLALLPGRARLGNKLKALGYCEATTTMRTILGDRGCQAKGHVFHWAEREGIAETVGRMLSVRKGDERFEEGFTNGGALGSWLHLHFASNSSIASSFVAAAKNYGRRH